MGKVIRLQPYIEDRRPRINGYPLGSLTPEHRALAEEAAWLYDIIDRTPDRDPRNRTAREALTLLRNDVATMHDKGTSYATLAAITSELADSVEPITLQTTKYKKGVFPQVIHV